MSTTKFQNPGRPRFYVDLLQYYRIIGEHVRDGMRFFYPEGYDGDFPQGSETAPEFWDLKNQYSSPLGRMDPYTNRYAPASQDGCVSQSYVFDFDNEYDGTFDDHQDKMKRILSVPHIGNYVNFCAVLGCKFSGKNFENNLRWKISPFINRTSYSDASNDTSPIRDKAYFDMSYSNFKNVIGTERFQTTDSVLDNSVSFVHKNGFYIWEMNGGLSTAMSEHTVPFTTGMGLEFSIPDFNYYEDDEYNPGAPERHAVNCMMMGRYYDMPVSPNMQLTFERSFEGMDTIMTKGGSNFTNIRYSGPPAWGEHGPGFTKYAHGRMPSDKLQRVGRRKWRLKFDFLSDDDVMGGFESLTTFPYAGSEWGPDGNHNETALDFVTPQDDGADITQYNMPLLEENNIFSQLYQKTLGGRIPFLFSPRGANDTPDNSPDQFAICTIDNKTLSMKQVAHRTYSLNMDIVESW